MLGEGVGGGGEGGISGKELVASCTVSNGTGFTLR